ncbi:MAG: potassium channel family protein [Stellaceae bacterium]
MLYFSLATPTTTGYGDIVPVDPFARSLANLESVLGYSISPSGLPGS